MKISKKNKFLIYLEAVQNIYQYEFKWKQQGGRFNRDLYLKFLKAREL